MNANKIVLITSVILVIFGSILIALSIGMMSLSDNAQGQIQTRTITETINKIDVTANIGDIRIIRDNTDVITVTYYEDSANQYYISTVNEILLINSTIPDKTVKWYDRYINLNFGTRDKYDIIIKIPRTQYADFNICSKYGDIEAENIAGGYINTETDCGDIELIKCEFTNITGLTNYGDIKTNNLIADNTTLNTDCGDIELTECGFSNITCSTKFGDIEANHFSGNTVTLKTDCGDIEGTIIGNEADYSINAETNLGDKNVQNTSNGSKILEAKTDLGDIDIKFIN